MQQCGTKNLTYPPFFLNGCGFGTSIPKSLFKTIFICEKKNTKQFSKISVRFYFSPTYTTHRGQNPCKDFLHQPRTFFRRKPSHRLKIEIPFFFLLLFCYKTSKNATPSKNKRCHFKTLSYEIEHKRKTV